MMTKKLTERKHSIALAELFEEAFAQLKHLPREELDKAIAERKEKSEKSASLPKHIRVIQRLGVIDAARGFTDQDIDNFIQAQELAARELKNPRDFVSKGSTSAKQSTIASEPRNRKNDDYVEIWAYVKPKLRRHEKWESILADAVEHFNGKNGGEGFNQRKITRAIKWARENPEKVSDDR